MTLDNTGILRFAAMLYVPKSDDGDLGFRVTLAISAARSPSVRALSVRPAKLPD